ncbi:hypothetical protein EOA27_00535 [Mesorhizobium sp. M2A.F.Ca.ET.037.01.1.1]|uniref:hypothetical protein n=1 Tax=unclassified Mesorhizobium TaxID=325217 RepID=UPI000F7607FF|nr:MULTISPECIES: hypothetical protein [unclassified Mesorhizobium]RUY13117.1 hypothetical protein EOA25_01425 [Mesorhizobium sp. M2A.F.Ca.ET.040.01.1.1]AZO16055.1 hypothetical protein EJ069_15825 [Mesorhizobium sp. M2A.F.Ca.ET.043.05.1.1]RUX23392.1 hypothetical protein EOA27_00535 [Mesorhizobium sp. M2A.F.Ca.ET.037.01.1.1]RWA89221.1 MAG: hypothetical protein EOQ31_18535 [Mesorhizobium sp.]RWE85346.1 MAG: hypothetical protein EOS63_01540 [Mesorhizobium sp.]
MSQIRTGFVLGYHGCDKSIADAAIAGGKLKSSAEKYDWLGPGAYFWEGDPRRALEWAQDRHKRGKIKHPAVLGAVIDLGNCLDLTTRDDLELLKDAYASLKKGFDAAGKKLPENSNPPKGGKDKLLRYLDCAVIEHLHENMKAHSDELSGDAFPSIRPFDTVRGLFLEGSEIYPGGGFFTHTHTQIAVRNERSIIGYFRPA